MEEFIPYGRQTVTEEDISAVVDVLRSRFLTQGPVVAEFEEAVSKYTRSKYAVSVNSATSALHIACLALGLKDGDRLWTSPISFVASANCGVYCGAEINFVDIEPTTGLICIEALRKKLRDAKERGRLPKVVIPVHLSGTSCSMEEIAALAEEYGFDVIEDASHAIGGTYKGEPVGGCRYSRITVFSFHPVKIITTGEGGIATTNDAEIAERMMDLRSHGIVRDLDRFELKAEGPWKYEQQSLGFNYRMTDIQAALGLSQLKRVSQIVNERRRLISVYAKKLEDLPVKLLEVPTDRESAQHLAVIRLNEQIASKHLHVFNELRSDKIGVQLHYSPIHLQPYYRRLGFGEGDYAEAEAYSRSAISLPLFPGLEDNDQERVAESLKKALA